MSHAHPEPRVPSTADGQVPAPRESGQGHEGTERPPAQGTAPEPPRTQRLPSLVAMVLFGVLCLGGFGYTLLNFTGAIRVFTAEAVVSMILLAGVGVLGFWILRRIRPVRAPSLTFSLLALIWGMTGAIGLALVANQQLMSAWSRAGGLEFGSAWGAALTAPINEELLKVTGVVLIAVIAPRAVRGPIDGFIMGALVGLGFQLVEDLTYALNMITMQGATEGMASVVQTLFLRVGLTGLGSHWAMSAVAGTAIGLLAAAAWRPGARRGVGALLLLLLAMGVHWFFDSPLMGNLLGILVKTLAVFLAAVVVYFVARHAYRGRVRQSLAEQGEELGIRRSSAVALANRHGRRNELSRVAHPERPAVRARQEQMVAAAEDRASEYRG
ncbi:PrsW family glutamic-type intramembrane protease [Nocardiopsis exhalans]|uniref:PrsW family glutamic-type intramembrane protease n=1 Tax=Nocardiopsis exhalans TaxID=163604 RepID=A0ABY5DGT7_9ACTN|nr:PrsW family glutamic-type intramembrane protease [Nocardiopsis exhalans]USY22332.1 PrsW family glutamic-type intramembrane protease [Nocardiopsis exhalans]